MPKKDESKRRSGFTILICCILLLAAFSSLWFSRTKYFDFFDHTDTLCKEIGKINAEADAGVVEKEIKKAVAFKLEKLHELGYWKSLLQHFSIACFLAMLLIAIVETHTRRRFQREAAEAVMFAVLQKQIPDPVFFEIRDHILRKPYYRKDWRYDFIFKGQPYDGLPDNVIVLHYTIRWTIMNISTEKVEYKPYVSIFNLPRATVKTKDKEGNEVDLHLSRHRGVWIDEKRALSKKEILKQENKQRKKDVITLDIKPVVLKPGEEKKVRVIKEEIAYHPSASVWAMGGYGENLKVSIINMAEDLVKNPKPDLLHPRVEKLEQEVGTGDWFYKGGLFPNQVLKLSWEAVSKKTT